MSSQANSLSIGSFRGGMNSRDAAHAIGESESQFIQNFELSEDGSLIKRAGSAKYNSAEISALPIHSAFRYYKSATVFKEFLVVSGSTLYKGNDGAGTFSSIGSLTAADPCTFVVWGDICYIANGTVFKQYNGTTLSDVAGTPQIGKYVTFHKNRLFVSGVLASPNIVYYCDTEDPTSWTVGSNFLPVRSNDGDEVTGLLTIGDDIAIYKKNSIWLLAGNSSANFFLAERASSVGCIAPKSLTSYNGVHFFLSSGGVYVFDRARAVKISGKVDPQINSIPSTAVSSAVGIVYKERYWLSYTASGSTENDTILLFDLREGFGSWVVFAGITALCFSNIWQNKDDEGELYIGDSSAGFAWQLDTGVDDDGTDIAANLISKNWQLGNVVEFNEVRSVHIVAGSSGAVVSMFTEGDYGAKSSLNSFSLSGAGVSFYGSSVFGVGVWSLNTIAVQRQSCTTVIARGISLEIQESSAFALSIFSLGFEFAPKGLNYGVLG